MAAQPSLAEQARPFIKWAGGKSQLLPQIRECYPEALRQGRLRRYAEPFLGGAAVFLDVAQAFDIESAYLSDINPELVLVYRVVQEAPADLVELLEGHTHRYSALDDELRERYFYETRETYNAQLATLDFTEFSYDWVIRAANMIFLNKTCYNGLYRVNSKGSFNVPFGRYRRPNISDPDNIMRISRLLGKAIIVHEPFTACESFASSASFVYFDPPYRPLNQTSNFTSYSKDGFSDRDQTRLAEFFAHLDREYDSKLMLSNSDPKNSDPDDEFFDELYAPFVVRRVLANRMINSKGAKRGKITELLITNY
ncbi:MAG: DNA adenine methylase [Caldilineaceae bacterium]|jgi:DNA adenine methylase